MKTHALYFVFIAMIALITVGCFIPISESSPTQTPAQPPPQTPGSPTMTRDEWNKAVSDAFNAWVAMINAQYNGITRYYSDPDEQLSYDVASYWALPSDATVQDLVQAAADYCAATCEHNHTGNSGQIIAEVWMRYYSKSGVLYDSNTAADVVAQAVASYSTEKYGYDFLMSQGYTNEEILYNNASAYDPKTRITYSSMGTTGGVGSEGSGVVGHWALITEPAALNVVTAVSNYAGGMIYLVTNFHQGNTD